MHLYIKSTCFAPDIYYIVYKQFSKAFIRNPLSLLAHERSRFANCQWELLTPTDISIPLIHRLVLYHLKRGIAYSAFNSQEFIYQFSHYLIIEDKIYLMHSCICCGKSNRHDYFFTQCVPAQSFYLTANFIEISYYITKDEKMFHVKHFLISKTSK